MPSEPSLPVDADMKLDSPEGSRTLEQELNAGGKLWADLATESLRFVGIAMYVMWECNPIAMAARLGITEPDRYKALLHVLQALREGQLVEVVGARHCYIHARGRPGAPQFLARMRPQYIVSSEAAWCGMTPAEQNAHWLGTTVARGSKGSMPIYKAWPYLLVGDGPWDLRRDTFPRAAGATYCRAGAPGTPWWVGVEPPGEQSEHRPPGPPPGTSGPYVPAHDI
jgi:hypothetical protein